MNHQEAAAVCRVVAALCPAQKMDEATPDTWAIVLDDVNFGDAQAAVKALGKRQTFISPSEIRAEVRSVRAKRIALAGDLTPPSGLSEDETRAWLRDARRRIGDGQTYTPPELPPANPERIRELIAGVGQQLDD